MSNPSDTEFVIVFKCTNSTGAYKCFYKPKYGDIAPYIIDAERFDDVETASAVAAETISKGIAKSMFSHWVIEPYNK